MKQHFMDGRQDMRRYVRQRPTQPIDVTLWLVGSGTRTWLSYEGELIDFSECGFCVQASRPISPGCIVWLDGSSEEEKAGFVRWCRAYENAYKIGIELEQTHTRALHRATDTFMEELRRIEAECEQPTRRDDDILADLSKAIDMVCEACATFERHIRNQDVIRQARVRFREKTNPILSKSYCINRARTWPQGYQGDYKTLETLYRNTPLSDGIGYYLDKLMLTCPLAEAVRSRIAALETFLREEFRARRDLRVLNIACGSCRELIGVADDIAASGARVTCIDLDNDALSFAADRLLFTAVSPLTSEHLTLRKYNAVRMFDHELNMQEFGEQDLIYSVGFFDYLDSPFLAKLFRALYRLLSPGGLLIASFKDADRYRHQEYHWISDWDGFLQRNVSDFMAIFREASIPPEAITETRDRSGIIVFYFVRKGR